MGQRRPTANGWLYQPIGRPALPSLLLQLRYLTHARRLPLTAAPDGGQVWDTLLLLAILWLAVARNHV